LFLAISFARADQPNDIRARTVCVDDHEHPKPCTEPEQHESILGLRVLGIGDQQRLVIQKDRLCLRERDPVRARFAAALT
jgi:hypothetical protein